MTIDIETKTNETITAELLAGVPDTYQKNAGYFIWDFLRAISYILEQLWIALKYLVGCFDITKLDYDDLVKFVYQRRGINAHKATYSSGVLTVTGSGQVSEGNIFETPAGLQFQAIETKNLADGESFNAECLTFGSVGNVPVGAITVIPTTIQGITSVTNTSAFMGGYDAETKDSIIERYLDDLQKPISSGNIYHYEKWAKECTGVGKVKVKPLWDGDNTVKIIITDSNFQTANSTLVSSVQTYIDPYTLIDDVKVGWGCGNGQAPIGAYCTVESATALNVNVSVSITLKTGQVLADVKTNIENSINEYLKTTVFNDNYVSYAQISSRIINTDGVEDLSDLTVNSATDNVNISETDTSCEIAVLGTLTVSKMSE